MRGGKEEVGDKRVGKIRKKTLLQSSGALETKGHNMIINSRPDLTWLITHPQPTLLTASLWGQYCTDYESLRIILCKNNPTHCSPADGSTVPKVCLFASKKIEKDVISDINAWRCLVVNDGRLDLIGKMNPWWLGWCISTCMDFITNVSYRQITSLTSSLYFLT